MALSPNQSKSVIVVEGVVAECLPGTQFRVKIKLADNKEHELIAYLGGKMRIHYIKLLPGDSVRVEMSPHDLTKGRITYRNKPEKSV